MEREPTTDPEVGSLEERVEAFRKANGKDPGPFVDTWRSGEIEDTPENAINPALNCGVESPRYTLQYTTIRRVHDGQQAG